MKNWKFPAALVLFFLSACGGGGGGSNTSAMISGKVIDGYIRGAIVFWDCNDNYVLDSNEVFTTSTSGGNYEISKSNENCSLMANIPVGAIDESTNAEVKKSYTMLSIQGEEQLITPLTTLVQGQISSGMNKADAVVSVQNAISQNELLVDYIANGNNKLQSIAKATVNYLSDNNEIEAKSLSVNALKYISPISQNPSLLEASDFDLIFTRSNELILGFLKSPSDDIVYATNPKLDNVAELINSKKLALLNSNIDWRKLDYTDLKTTFEGVVQLNLAINNEELNNIRLRRDIQAAKLSPMFAEIEKSEKLFTKDFKSNYDLLAGLLFDGVGYYVDYVQLRAGLPIEKVAKVKGWYKAGKIPVSSIDLMTRLSKAKFEDWKDCADFAEEFISVISTKDDLVGFDATQVAGCIALVSKLSNKLKGSPNFATGIYQVYDIPREEWGSGKGNAKLIGAAATGVQGLLEFFDAPIATRSAAVADGVARFSNAVVRSYEYEEKVSLEGVRATEAAVLAAQKAFVESVWRPYYVEYLSLYDGYFTTEKPLTIPTIKTITASNGAPNTADAVTFTATVSSDNGAITAWSWNFGDNTATSSEQSPTHTFTVAGTYTVTLTVTDAKGKQASKQIAITVSSSGQQVAGTWTGFDSETLKYTSAIVYKDNGFIRRSTSGSGSLRFRFQNTFDGDNFRFSARMKNDPAFDTSSYRDMGIQLRNDFATGNFDANGNETPSRWVGLHTRNGYSTDFFYIGSSAGSRNEYTSGVLSNATWHTYTINVKNGVISLYYDGTLKYTATYQGSFGTLDTLVTWGMNNVQIEPSSISLSAGQ